MFLYIRSLLRSCKFCKHKILSLRLLNFKFATFFRNFLVENNSLRLFWKVPTSNERISDTSWCAQRKTTGIKYYRGLAKPQLPHHSGEDEIPSPSDRLSALYCVILINRSLDQLGNTVLKVSQVHRGTTYAQCLYIHTCPDQVFLMSDAASSQDPAPPCSPSHAPRLAIERGSKEKQTWGKFKKTMTDTQQQIHGQLVKRFTF